MLQCSAGVGSRQEKGQEIEEDKTEEKKKGPGMGDKLYITIYLYDH